MSHDTFLASDHPLTADERRDLRSLAGIMIPASTEYGVPGADDEAIFTDILGAARAGAESVRSALRSLDALAGEAFADLDVEAQRAVCERFRTSGSPLVGVVVALDAQTT